ncbi:unnamed protein product [Cylicocyclus nassatus]|uniref:L-Fucosyltransferase n=1 Tax=Cylicocyclus nassatus TaxID=53992 RepID=A0AA36H391_CYLNA|nr:unnamed protein product [Cylicocyclus nassatus]
MATLLEPIASATLFILLLFSQSHFFLKTHNSCHREERFIALTVNQQRLGNQLFHLAAGYGIARKAQRTFYYPMIESRRKVRYYLKNIAETFPKTVQMYKIFQAADIKQMVIKFASDEDWFFKGCCLYEDPTRFVDHPAKFILLSQRFAQNARYLEDYLPELRELFRFSDIAKERGEADMRKLQIGNVSDFLCIHIRTTDFLDYGVASDMNGTVSAAEFVAKAQMLRQFLLLGDDKDFMRNLARTIVLNDEKRTVRISTFSEMSEFYISSQLCKSFLLSAPTSTMGWWLAFFTKDQQAVYYYKDRRKARDYKMLSDEFFLKSWHRVNG